MNTADRLDAGTVRELAVAAECDPRTIERAYAGMPVRGLAGKRARRALREAGLLQDRPCAERSAREESGHQGA